MINKLYKFRQYIPDDVIELNPYGIETDERQETVIVMGFELKQKDTPDDIAADDRVKYEFKGCHLETYSKKKNLTQYFFKKVTGRGTSEFPTVFITYDDLNDSYFTLNQGKGKLIQIFQKYEDKKIKQLLEDLVKAREQIVESVREAMQSRANDKELYILTICINNQYIGESDLFDKIRKNAGESNFLPYYSLSQSKQIAPKNKICSICLARVGEVWGYVSTFNFYTAKTEFAPISGGFNKEESWKNYPVCPDCAKKLDQCRYVLERYMRYYFCGFSYFLIPEFLHQNDTNNDIMECFLDRETALGKFTLNNEDRNTITYAENEILDHLQESDNSVNYTMFFFERNNREFKILLEIEDIYPSQFKVVFDAKQRAEEYKIFKGLKNLKEKTIYDLKFKFELIKEFLPLSQDKTLGNAQVFKKHFLEIIRSVFLQKKVDTRFILHLVIESFKKRFANDQLYPLSVLKIILTLKFFIALNIIDLSSRHHEKEVIVDTRFQDFFDEHSDFFDSSSKKAVFLEGVLCQNLLNIQYTERSATPFRNRLNSLKMNPKIIRRLLPEMIEKLEQYKKNYYRDLEEAISRLLLASHLDKLSNDELSFYFVMGMNLNKEFTKPDSEITKV